MTNITIDTRIFKEMYPEDKVTDDDQDHILEELRMVFRGSPTVELPHLTPYRLEECAFIYACADQHSGPLKIKSPAEVYGYQETPQA
jgi:hypothetical protein